MEYLYLAVDFVVTYIESAIALKVMDLVFERRVLKSRLLHPMLCALYLSIMYFSLEPTSPLLMVRTVLIFVSMTLVVTLCFQARLYEAATVTGLYYLCVAALDCFAVAILGTINGDHMYGSDIISIGIGRVVYICIIKAILILIYITVKYIMENTGKIRLTSKHYTGLWCIDCIGYCIIYLAYEDTHFNLNKTILVNWISLILALIVSISLVSIYIKYRESINEQKITEMHGKLLEDKYESINQLYMQRSTEFHDFKNHLLALFELVQNDEKEKTLDYIMDLTKSQEKVSKKEWSGNSIIDFILDTKYGDCLKNNIRFSVEAGLSEISTIKDKDMCNIFGNLLDNAIEACQKIPDEDKRYIDITLKTINNIILIDIKNSVYQRPIEKNGKLISTKANTLIHGLGLESVQRAVDKYSGHLEYIISDDEFEVYITLYF